MPSSFAMFGWLKEVADADLGLDSWHPAQSQLVDRGRNCTRIDRPALLSSDGGFGTARNHESRRQDLLRRSGGHHQFRTEVANRDKTSVTIFSDQAV